MNIGVHISSRNSFLIPAVSLLSSRQPENTFIIFTTEEIPGLPQNCSQIIIRPKPANRLLSFYWYHYKLPALLKKNSADTFLSDSEMLSAKSTVPQYLYFNDDNFLNRPSRFFKKQFLKSLAKAAAIFVAEDFIRDELVSKFALAADKIIMAYPGLDQPGTVATGAATLIKEKFTYGLDYFLYPVNESSAPFLIMLLKAFSKFKNRQKSSMQLVLLAEENMDTEELVPDFKNYKFRTEVKIISAAEKNAGNLLQHAYALVWFGRYSTGNNAFAAMAYHVPVIALENGANKSLFGAAALYAPAEETILSEKIQELYRDEILRKNIIDNGTSLLQKYDTATSANAIWQKITVAKTVIPLRKITE